MARIGVLAVPCPRTGHRGPRKTLRLDVEPQLREPARARLDYASHEPADGCCGGDHRRDHRYQGLGMTENLTSIRGIAVPLLWDNVDTDALAPAAPHKLIGGGRDRLREILFYESRFAADGQPKAGFVLNDARFSRAPI